MRQVAGSSCLWVLSLISGCGVPPPPPELNAFNPPSSAEPVQSIELILAGPEQGDRFVWTQHARSEAGRVKSIFSATAPDSNDRPAQQAELIRAATARGVSAIIVEPANGPEIATALDEARSAGTVVVLLDRAVPSRDPSKPFARVYFGPLEPMFGKLVDKVQKDLRASKLAEDGKVVLFVNAEPRPGSAEIISAVRDALDKAGVGNIETLTYEGTSETAKPVLLARVEPDSKVTTVLAHEEAGLEAALQVLQELKSKRPLVIAGCISMDKPLTGFAGMVSVMIDRNQAKLIRQAFRLASGLARGEDVPGQIEVPLEFHP